MTPRSSDDASRYKLSLRDVVLLLVGGAAMYGAQVGAQWGLRSDIRDLKTSLDNYVVRQTDTNLNLQQQINDWRAETRLNRIDIQNDERMIAELKGLMAGAGIKGVPK